MAVHPTPPSRDRRLPSVLVLAAALAAFSGCMDADFWSAEAGGPPQGTSPGDALPIEGLPFHYEGVTEGQGGLFAAPASENIGCGPIGASLWFSWTPSADLTVRFDTEGSDFDTMLAVYEGDTAAADELACSDDEGPGTLSQLTLETTADQPYLVRVGGFQGDAGDLVFHMEALELPPNMLRAAATAIGSLPYENVQSTEGAITEPDEVFPSCAPMGATVWYVYETGPTDVGILRIDTFGSDFDTVLAVHGAAPIGPLTATCNDDTGTSLESQMQFDVMPSSTYWIQVGGYAGDFGELVFHATRTV